MTPGIHDGLPADDYHAAPGISKSGLSRFADCPARFRWGKPATTEALRFGSLIHTAILEPVELDRRYKPSGLTRFSEREKAYQDELAKAGGRELVKQADYDEARRIQEAVLAHPVVRELLTPDLIAERSFAWHDPATGVLCRGRADGVNPAERLFVDIKTCADASHDAFAKAAHAYRYHWQAEMYTAGMQRADGWRANGFFFICVEKEPPYLTAVYEIGEPERELARFEVDAALARYAECLARDEWPGHSDLIEVLSFPRYAFA